MENSVKAKYTITGDLGETKKMATESGTKKIFTSDYIVVNLW